MISRLEVKFSGTLAKPPIQTTSRYGRLWTRLHCNVDVYREHTSEPVLTWVTISIRGDDGHQYMHLPTGTEIAVEGELRLNSYEKDGLPLIGISINPTSIRIRERVAP